MVFNSEKIKSDQKNLIQIIVKDSLANDTEIYIKAFQLPIINKGLLNQELESKVALKELFEPTRALLKQKIEQILLPTVSE
ncbi:hypothetical protein [Pedobacter changchengzhani]|uniref:hypothetical protein n=1 Tax=Pedobacter changchengzhani TaxID=2529274 RepID=UPI0010584EF4|nr:hypothetical protein [Pedobacter changchengzhani]